MVNIELILKKWNITNFDTFDELDKGNVNKNWIVKKNGKKFVLKEMEQSKTIADLIFEFSYLQNLRNANFPYVIPEPLRTKEGNLYLKENNRLYMLYEFIEGVTIDKLSLYHLTEIGKMVAQYHKILVKSNLFKGIKTTLKGYNTFVLEELQSFQKEVINQDDLLPKDAILKKYESPLEKILRRLNVETYNEVDQYSIHRDLGGDNIIWMDNHIKGIIDFENVSAYNEPLVKDLSVIITYSCRNDLHQEQTEFKKLQSLLNEYSKLRTLREVELILIPYFMINGIIEDFNYAYWLFKNNKSKANIERLERYAKSAIWHFENRDELLGSLKP